MPWRGHEATTCKVCGRGVEECGPLSARYKCASCSETALLENRRQLIAHRGPYFDRLRRACVAAWGGILPEDVDAPDLEEASNAHHPGRIELAGRGELGASEG